MLSEETERLRLLRKTGLLDSAADARLDRIVELVAGIFDVPIALVSLVDENRQWFKCNYGLTGTAETPRDIAFCDFTIRKPELFVVENALDDERFNTNPLVTGDPNIRFYAGAPLIMRQKYAIGTLCLIDYKPRELSDSDCDRLRKFADVIVGVLDTQTAARLANFDDAVDDGSDLEPGALNYCI